MQESESLHWWIILVWTVHSLQSHLMTNTVFMRDCMPIQITRYWLMLTMYYFPMWILTPSFFDSTHLSMIFQMFEILKNVRLTVITEKNIRTKYPGACSLEYHQVIRVFNICMLQWDCKNKRSKGRGALLDGRLPSHQRTRSKVRKSYIHIGKYGWENCPHKFARIYGMPT